MPAFATLAEFNWSQLTLGVLTVLFILASVLLVLTVLIQKPQGGGLAGAFGSGAGSGQTAFGARTGDALTVMTIIMFVLFLASGIALKFAMDPKNQAAAPAVTAPATSPATAPTTTPSTTPNTGTNPAPAAAVPPADEAPASSPSTAPATPAEPATSK